MNQVISSNNGRLCGIEEGANHANELRLPCSVPDPSCQPHGCPFPCLATEGETSSSTLSPCCCGPEGLEGNEHEHEHEHEPTERAEEEEVIFVSEDDEDSEDEDEDDEIMSEYVHEEDVKEDDQEEEEEDNDEPQELPVPVPVPLYNHDDDDADQDGTVSEESTLFWEHSTSRRHYAMLEPSSRSSVTSITLSQSPDESNRLHRSAGAGNGVCFLSQTMIFHASD